MSAGLRLLVMRHGPAEAAGPAGDAARALSVEGRERMRLGLAALARILPAPRRIYTSPLVRARQTAELLAAAFDADSPVVTPLLAPGFDRARLIGELARAALEPLAIVGHEPDLSGFVASALGASGSVEFDKGSACLLEMLDAHRAVLRALYPLEAMTRLARPG
ncbi:MAG TPA: histidine phosphatase family protein [Gammaproteobacteria bacterium]|nr:histidine phosphatase family protein [Gammaproteobacteria bacterium]